MVDSEVTRSIPSFSVFKIRLLTLKAPITTAADNIHKYIVFFHCFSVKIRLNVSSESSARQRIHLKKSSLIFSLKDKSKN